MPSHRPWRSPAPAACGACWLKVSLGHYRAGNDLSELALQLAGQLVQLLVENDQTAQSGHLEALPALFAAAEAPGSGHSA